jgi:N-acetylmuramoyl-L-alanine amidase
MGTPYTVVQGDCLSSIARRFGLEDWRIIYNHPDNADFKRNRPNPNLIYPGDQLIIPSLDPTPTDGCAVDQKHTFEVTLPQTLLVLKLSDGVQGAYANKPYTLVLDGVVGSPFEGTLDGEGKVEKPIPPDASSGVIDVFPEGRGTPPIRWRLSIGTLDPAAEIDGQQARLNNLGYNAGYVDGADGPAVRAAAAAFQKKKGLPQQWPMNQASQSALTRDHGC